VICAHRRLSIGSLGFFHRRANPGEPPAAPSDRGPGPAALATAATVIALGVAASIVLRSPALALVTIVAYAAAFAVLTAWRLPLAVVALVVALPLITLEVGVLDVRKTVGADKAAVAAVAAVALLLHRARLFPRVWERPLGRWWVALLLVFVASVIRNGATAGELWGGFGLFVYAVIFAAALDAFEREPRLAQITPTLAALTAGGVAALVAIERLAPFFGRRIYFYFKQGTVLDSPLEGGTIAAPNFLGAYLILLLPIVLWVAARRAGQRALWVLIVVLVFIAMTHADSMGAWLGLAIASVAVFIVNLVLTTSRRRLIGFAAVCLVAVLAGTLVVAEHLKQSRVSFDLRLAAYRVGLEAVRERPWLGFGTNGYERQYARLEQRIFGRELTEFHEPGHALSAHSAFLSMAVERGVLGLAAFCGLLGSLFVHAVRRLARSRTVAERGLISAILAGLAAFTAQALTENLFSYSKLVAVFWIMAAALLCLPPLGDNDAMAAGSDADRASAAHG
jgi:O-antigen ligase/polysaccharide polymerase Wzy-like membrane protein